MSEKPILFNQDMIHAILEGRKVQTRRIIKPQPEKSIERDPKGGKPLAFWKDCSAWVKPPYQVGDVMWVRETWQYIVAEESEGYVYRASQNGIDWEQNSDDWKWKPSIFMPHEAARIFLKITDVKVQRIQDITWEEIFKEGAITDATEESIHELEDKARGYRDNNIPVYEPDYCREAFKNLWNSLYAFPRPVKEHGTVTHYISYPWEDIQETKTYKGLHWTVCGNCWVWVYSFERIKGDNNE